MKESIVNLKQNILLIELRKIEPKYLKFIIQPCDKECYYLTEIKFKVYKLNLSCNGVKFPLFCIISDHVMLPQGIVSFKCIPIHVHINAQFLKRQSENSQKNTSTCSELRKQNMQAEKIL